MGYRPGLLTIGKIELIDTLWNVNGDNVFTYEADELPN